MQKPKGIENSMLKLGSLFDGIGGWQLAATRAGIQPIWSSEIEKLALAVTKCHFPNTIQLGDINTICGNDIEPVDIICAGSPCQDLSVAGKREGLKGERSGLFKQAINIIKQMHEATGGQYPRFFIWENVPGAFSINRGLDFKSVLEEITETSIPMPNSGRWSTAGMVRNHKCEVAWRMLDAQYFGVPQRRKRIFLITDFRGRNASKVLFERKDLSRNIKTCKTEQQTHTSRIGDSFVTSKWGLYENHAQDSRVKGALSIAPTVSYNYGSGGNNIPLVLSVYENGGANVSLSNKCGALTTGGGKPGQGFPCIYSSTDRVRKLTPLECERLQGLPDDWTLVPDKYCSDSARYRAIGNGMAQPVADWIMKRVLSRGVYNEI